MLNRARLRNYHNACYGSLLFGEEPHSMVLLKGARSPTGEVESGPKLG